MLNLNPELVNQDKIRKARRKRMLKIAAFPCAVILIASLFVFRVGIFNIVYSVSYGNQNYDVANSMADFQGLGNVISPYIKYYDGGVAKLKNKQYENAEKDFRSSLKENPPEKILCNIYVNLSLSIEYQADEEFKKENYEDSLVLYTKARSTLFSNGCADKNATEDNDQSKDKNARNSVSRIDKKASIAMNKMNSSEDVGGDDTPTNTDKIITKDQERKLQKRRDSQNEIIWNVQNSVRGASGGSSCDSVSHMNICW